MRLRVLLSFYSTSTMRRLSSFPRLGLASKLFPTSTLPKNDSISHININHYVIGLKFSDGKPKTMKPLLHEAFHPTLLALGAVMLPPPQYPSENWNNKRKLQTIADEIGIPVWLSWKFKYQGRQYHSDPVSNKNNPCQYFHRLSQSTPRTKNLGRTLSRSSVRWPHRSNYVLGRRSDTS